MGIFYFPCNFVYWKKIQNHEKIKKGLLQLLENNSGHFEKHPLVEKGISTYYSKNFSKSISQYDELINSVVWESIDELVKKLDSREGFQKIKIRKSLISNCWCSKYDKNSVVSCHNHSADIPQAQHFIDNEVYRSTFSLIYIVNDENEKNQTEFLEPSMLGNNVSSSAETRFKTCHVDEIGEGTVLIFPSNLYHQVNPIPKSGRIILSFNVISTFD
jgi:hypothetical protein